MSARPAALWQRGRRVWQLIPGRHKTDLAGAAALMAGTSLCNTALPLLLGRLVDEVQAGSDQGAGAGVPGDRRHGAHSPAGSRRGVERGGDGRKRLA